MAEPRPELRRLRQAKGLTIKEAAKRLNMSPDNLGRIEAGRHSPQGENFRNYAKFLDISYQRLTDILEGTYVPGAVEENSHQLVPKKFTIFVALEAQSQKVEVYADRVIDGLCQTEDYMRVLIEGERGLGPTTEQRVDLRRNRQKALSREPEPLRYSVILYEAALCLEVGDNRTMREQFGHLERLAQQPNVDIRVRPFSAGPCHLDFGGFHLLTLPHEDEPSVAYEDLYDGPHNRESPDYVSKLTKAYRTLLSMSLTPDASLELIGRMKRRYPA